MTRTASVEQLAATIVALQLDHATRVAIDGVDGSGKTTLANELVDPIRQTGREVIRAVESQPRIARQNAVLLFDGVFLLRPELQGLWDLTVWLEVPFEITVERAVARDAQRGGDSSVIRGKYESRYVPGQRLYMDQCQPHQRADVVFHNTDLDQPIVKVRDRGRV